MPKTIEELEADLTALAAKLEQAEGERVKLQTKVGEFEGKTKTISDSALSVEAQLKEALKLREEVAALKAAKPGVTPPPKADEDDDIESLLTPDDKAAAEQAFEKLTEEHRNWVLADKKNKSQFLSDVVGKKSPKGKSLFGDSKPTPNIRDQIREALNIELDEGVPPGSSQKSPTRQKPKKDNGDEITTSVPNGDILGALRQLDKKKS